jgi:hypothetical protein
MHNAHDRTSTPFTLPLRQTVQLAASCVRHQLIARLIAYQSTIEGQILAASRILGGAPLQVLSIGSTSAYQQTIAKSLLKSPTEPYLTQVTPKMSGMDIDMEGAVHMTAAQAGTAQNGAT